MDPFPSSAPILRKESTSSSLTTELDEPKPPQTADFLTSSMYKDEHPEFSTSTPNSVEDEVRASAIVNATLSPVVPTRLPASLSVSDGGEDAHNIQLFLEATENRRCEGERDLSSSSYGYKHVLLKPKERVPFPGTNYISDVDLEPPKHQMLLGTMRLGKQYAERVGGYTLVQPQSCEDSTRFGILNEMIATPSELLKDGGGFQFGCRYDEGGTDVPQYDWHAQTPLDSSIAGFPSSAWNFQRYSVTGQNLMYTSPKQATFSTQSLDVTTTTSFRRVSCSSIPLTFGCSTAGVATISSSRVNHSENGGGGGGGFRDECRSVTPATLIPEELDNSAINQRLERPDKNPHLLSVSENSSRNFTLDEDGNGGVLDNKRQVDASGGGGADKEVESGAERSSPDLRIDSEPSSPVVGSVRGRHSDDRSASSGYVSGTSEHAYSFEKNASSRKRKMPQEEPPSCAKSGGGDRCKTSSSSGLLHQHLYKAQPVLNGGNGMLERWPPTVAYYYHTDDGAGNITSNPLNPATQELKAATMFSASALQQFATNQQQQYFNKYSNAPSCQQQHHNAFPVTTSDPVAASSSSPSSSVKAGDHDVALPSGINVGYYENVFASDYVVERPSTASSLAPSVGQTLMEEFQQQQQRQDQTEVQGQKLELDDVGADFHTQQRTHEDALTTVIQLANMGSGGDVIVGSHFLEQPTQVLADADDEQYLGLAPSAAADPHNPLTLKLLTPEDISPVAIASMEAVGQATTSAQGKKPRTIFSDAQCSKMRDVFRITPYITRQMKAELAQALDVDPDTIAVWFKNQRAKYRKHYHYQKDCPAR